MTENRTIKNFCSRCHYETNHKSLFVKEVESDPDEYHCKFRYAILECLGCERISFREDFYDFESAYPDHNGNWNIHHTTDIYPNKLKNHNPLSFVHLPQTIRKVYEEAINAFSANCHLLTGVAFRAIIEAVCIDKKIAGRDLESKINNLAKNRLITEKEANRLHSVRFVGNDSVHEMAVPKERALYVVLNIVEHLLNNLYLIDVQAKGNIDTVISGLDDFRELLDKCMRKFAVDDELPLAKILGKDVRRLSGRLDEFEKELIAEINAGSYVKLGIGKIDKYGNSPDSLRHFIIRKEAFETHPDDVPF